MNIWFFVNFLGGNTNNDLWNEKWGFYFLKDKEKNIENRRDRQLASVLKLKAAERAAKKLRSIPFLRAIFICNTVAAGQAKEDSDIDFLVEFKKGRGLFDDFIHLLHFLVSVSIK